MDFRHLIVTCLFSKLRLPFDNQKVKENYAIFLKETHKDRRLLPNPALSGRCIEDFYPLVYFLGLCKGLSYLLYKNMFEKHPHRKNAPHSPYGKKDAQR